MRTKLTWLIAFIIFIAGLCYTLNCDVIELGENIDTVHDPRMDEPYYQVVYEPCTPENCECMACHEIKQ